MQKANDFDQLFWEIHKHRKDPSAPCVIAAEFEQKLNSLIFSRLGQSSREAIAKAKYLLQDEWHLWRDSIPVDHDRQVHHCVDDVYFTSFKRLQVMDLVLRPIENLIINYYEDRRETPPPAPRAPDVIIQSFPIGEEDE